MRSRRLFVLSFSGRSSERLSEQRWPSASWSVLLGLPVLLGLSGCLQEVDKPKYSADYDTAEMALDVTWLIDHNPTLNTTTQQQVIVQMAADGNALVLSEGERWQYRSSVSNPWQSLSEFRVGNQRSYQANWNAASTESIVVRFTRHSGMEYSVPVSRPVAIEALSSHKNDTQITVSFNTGGALLVQSAYRCLLQGQETRWLERESLGQDVGLYEVPFKSNWQTQYNSCEVTVSLQRESGVTKPNGFADGRVQSVLQHTLAPIALF